MRTFAFSVFLSALLLFMLEPFIGKALLPWFGGMPSVWSTCLLFFQVSLFAGYAYSHVLVHRLSQRAQVTVHLVLVGAALAALGTQALLWHVPVLPGLGLKPPNSEWPLLRLLVLLGLTVGLPFFTLSTTGPLAQAWFARVAPGTSPYRLYALSNAGSFLALLGYPFLVEPTLTLRQQGWGWAAGFAMFAVGVAAMGRARWRAGPSATAEVASSGHRTRKAHFAFWTLFAMVPSIMLMAVTNQLSQEVAVSPFLWVVPLALYLLSFILTFESTRWYARAPFLGALIVLLVGAFVVSSRQGSLGLGWQIAGLLVVLFVTSMFCHGELARRRPPVEQLTTFYLAVSLGGAVGAIFVPLVAPLLFNNYYELDVSFVLAWLVAMATLAADQGSIFHGPRRRLVRAGAAGYLYLLLFLVFLRVHHWQRDALEVRRNFYGLLKVSRQCEPGSPPTCAMLEVNGRTIHGLQLEDPLRRREATSYYTPRSGVGRVMAHHPARLAGRPMRIGVVGLGVGTLAAYGQTGDTLRFYEINPAAIELARAGNPYFTYLADSRAAIEMVFGDARLSLERELKDEAPQRYDLLVIDAFSSDAIPAHLLTREAIALYRAHLAGVDSILAIHVSNRNLELAPLVWSLAEQSGLACRELFTLAASSKGSEVELTARWMLLSEDGRVLDAPGIVLDGSAVVAREGVVRPWSDDFTNVLSVLK